MPGKPLEEYRRKRRFDRTSEPSGAEPSAGRAGLFVVQKHAARRLHYDFRLELEGVLVSWAVPKGPSLDPSQKRLAVHVEDHPLEYGDFEGSIPEGEYGAGTVIVWDRGTWEPAGESAADPAASLDRGLLKVVLHGEKLRGLWTLVRMKPRGDESPDKSWLLFKDRDGWARSSEEGDVLAERPDSVATGRTLQGVRDDPEAAVFSSAEKRLTSGRMKGGRAGVGRAEGGRAGGGRAARGRAKRDAHLRRPPGPARVAGAKKAHMPGWIEPQLATLVAEAPSGPAWIHEVKFDGYRMQCHVKDGAARLASRNGVDWTDRFKDIADACAALPVREATLDGEVVFVRPDGTTSFGDLKDAISAKATARLVFFVFDLLHLDGYDLKGAALADRKRVLSALVKASDPGGRVRYADHVEGSGDGFYREACRAALEGVVAKRADRPHRPGRSRDWLKVKCLDRQEFVVVGYTEPSGSRSGFGALLLGYHGEKGELVYAGRVGTGFSERTLDSLGARLKKLERTTSPLSVEPPRAALRGVHWVRPQLVAEVEFIEWTSAGALRHPSFVGLREDKPASEVVRETRSGGAKAGAARGREADGPTVAGIALTHPDKVLYPEQGLTKVELARYYAAIADRVLPHLVGRPLTLVRCPEGHEGECFYQKHVEAAYPKAVRRMTIEDSDGPATYAYVEDIAGVVGLVQMGVLEIHTWGARKDEVERPDRIVFDLDPGEGVAFERVIEAARVVYDGLAGLGLDGFVKTTGGKGLHVVAPIRRGPSWGEVRDFTRGLAQAVERAAPDRYTSNPSKAKRVGKVFVDYVRNTRGATAVAPYSTRARSGAPVSVPLTWEELEAGIEPGALTVATLPERLARLTKDPWDGYGSLRQRITARARRALGVG